MVRRPSKGLLGGLWEFPTFEITSSETLETGAIAFQEALGFAIDQARMLVSVPHQFTHLRAMFHAFRAKAPGGLGCTPRDALRWCTMNELNELAMPLAQQKIAQAVGKADVPSLPHD